MATMSDVGAGVGAGVAMGSLFWRARMSKVEAISKQFPTRWNLTTSCSNLDLLRSVLIGRNLQMATFCRKGKTRDDLRHLLLDLARGEADGILFSQALC